MIHEDERRILDSFPEAKIITAKMDCIIGQHYHKIKTEYFILIGGECLLKWRYKTNNGEIHMQIGKLISVSPNTYHEFHIKKGSGLVGINTHTYDPTDDYCD
jgi:D-lyxose ketol-isomerase